MDINVSRAQALLIMELIKENTEKILDDIMQTVEAESAIDNATHQMKSNYVTNLENLVKDLTEENAAMQKAAVPKKVFARKPKAQWGYKKDGTPKARPGRKV